MARYICHFLIEASPASIKQPLREIMQSCSMEMIYEIEDYLMAREIPGEVSFSKLVTAEVLIDTTTATESRVKISFVVKNDELPLKVNNHCQQIFGQIKLTISKNYKWQQIESIF